MEREIFRPEPVEGLTNQIQNFHNGGRGEFMAEGQGEVPKPSVKPEPETTQVGEAKKSIVPKRVKLARNAWEEYDRGKMLTPEERALKEELIGKGIPPVSGAQEVISTADITNDRILEEVNVLNALLHARGENDVDTLTKGLENVTRLNGAVPQDEKERIATELSNRIREILQRQRAIQEERERRGWYGEELIQLDDKEAVDTETRSIAAGVKTAERMTQLFNRVFARAEANPHTEFRDAVREAGQKEYTDFINLLNGLRADSIREGDKRRTEVISSLIKQYSSEFKLREIIHNAYFIAETGGEAKQFAQYTAQFASEFVDLAFLEAPEVEVAYRMREQVLYQIKRENGGRIPYEKVAFIAERGWSEWEHKTEELMREENEEKKVFGDTPLPQWRIDRALSISRGLGMVLLRFPEIVAECPLTQPTGTNPSQPSIPWETISWELNPLDHKIKRYEIAREMRTILYAAMERKKPWWHLWSQEELKLALTYNSLDTLASMGGEEAMIDLRNLSKIGGWATHSSWRSFVAALEEDQGALRKLLAQNPGLGPKLLFNRYEEFDLMKYKQEFIRDYKSDHPELHDIDDKTLARQKAFVDAWTKKDKELKEKGIRDPDRPGEKRKVPKVMTDDKNWETIQDAAGRIPHVILRIITDDANRLLSEGKAKELLRKIFDREPDFKDKAFQDLYTETENDLTFAKENLMKRRRESITRGEEWKPEMDRLAEEDFAAIGDAERIERARRLFNVVREELQTDETLRERILKKIETRGFPFVLTTEDVPFSEYRFAQTGGRGLITRRNNDWYQEVEANNATIELLKQIQRFQTPEQVVAQLGKIFDFAEVHDYDMAQNLIYYLAKGIIRLYEMDGIVKIPIFGELLTLARAPHHIGSSYAQTVYGGKAMAWNSDDVYNFTEQLRSVLIGERGFGLVDRLRKETGGQWWQAIGARTKIALYLLALFFMYELTKKVIEEK